jgi:hypothetical protein
MENTLDGFKKNSKIYSRCKNERRAVKLIGKTNGINVNVPSVPSDTRWFSLLNMMEAFMKSERAFKLHNMESDKMSSLTTSDWRMGSGFIEVMRPFAEVTKHQEGENYQTLSSVIPLLTILHDLTSRYFKNQTNSGYGITYARHTLSSMEDRFGYYPDFMLEEPFLFATFSDPIHSWLYFQDKPEIQRILKRVLGGFQDYPNNEFIPPKTQKIIHFKTTKL